MEGWAPGRGVGMNVEENQPVIDAFVDAFNRRDWDRVEKLHTESVIYRTPDNPKPKKGRAAVLDRFVGYVSAFPDARDPKELAFSPDDWACAYVVFVGSQKGPLMCPEGKV